MILVSFILFLSSLNAVCFTMICTVKWLLLSMESGGFDESDVMAVIGAGVCPLVLV